MKQIQPKPYPLSWPDNQERTVSYRRENGQFSQTPASALSSLKDELRMMRINEDDYVISTNCELRLDGNPRADSRPTDPGVAVWFRRKGTLLCIACDRFNTWWKNCRAIALVIEGRRREERYGTDAMIESAWSAFEVKELPYRKPWWEVLGIAENTPIEVAEAVYRTLAKKNHPDVGGSHERMADLNAAIEDARSAAREADR